MTLPSADHAIIDIRKLIDYSLNPDHPLGRHKAELFRRLLGIEQGEAWLLAEVFRIAVSRFPCRVGTLDGHGQRYVLDFLLNTPAGSAMVRTAWIVLADERAPRLVTCHVL